MKYKIVKLIAVGCLSIIILSTFQNCSPAKFKDNSSIEGSFALKDLSFRTNEDTPVDGYLPHYFVNPKVLMRQLTLAALPSFGTLYDSEGNALKLGDVFTTNFQYRPNPNKNGTDVFQVKEVDTQASRGEAMRIVTIEVAPVVDGLKIPRQTVTIATAPKSFGWGQADSATLNSSLLNDSQVNADGLKVVNLELKPGTYYGIMSCEALRCYIDDNGKIAELTYNPTTKEFTFNTNTADFDKVFTILAIDESGAAWEFELDVSFSNPIRDIKPSLAIGNSSCLLCHGQIEGTFITGFSVRDQIGRLNIQTTSGLPMMTYLDGVNYDYSDPSARDQTTSHLLSDPVLTGESFRTFHEYLMTGVNSTLFNNSEVIVPRAQLHDIDKAAANSYIQLFKSDVLFKWRDGSDKGSTIFSYNGIEKLFKGYLASLRPAYAAATSQYLIKKKFDADLTPINSVADYFDAMTTGRTTTAFTMTPERAQQTGFDQITINDSRINAQVREVSSVSVGAPTAAEIIKLKPNNGKNFAYFTMNGLTPVLEVNLPAGIKEETNYYMGSGTINCEGQLVLLSKPLLLENAVINTNRGCIIYSERTVFIQNTQAATVADRLGIGFAGGASGLHHLQLTSASGIALGMGECQSGVLQTASGTNGSVPAVTNSLELRKKYLVSFTNTPAEQIPMLVDQNLITNNGANALALKDAASTCIPQRGEVNDMANKSRKVRFERVLFNAPQIQSRYTGDFSGVVITKWAIWALGAFKYRFDSVFNSKDISYFPKLPAFFSSYFSVPKCTKFTERYPGSPGRQRSCE